MFGGKSLGCCHGDGGRKPTVCLQSLKPVFYDSLLRDLCQGVVT